MARINNDLELHSLVYFTVVLLGVISSIKAEAIVATTLAELRNKGWALSGSTPMTYPRPGAWKAALRPLDVTVGGEVWRVTSSADTIFRFDKFVNELCANSIKVEVKLFVENAVVSIYPWKDPKGTGSEYFYPRQPSGIQWVTETIDIRPGEAIEFKMKVFGSYIFFDQISINHDGVACDTITTTTESTTTDTDTTLTTEGDNRWTDETPIEETVEPGTTITNEEPSSTTQITTEVPTTSTPEEVITEEQETGETETTEFSTLPSTTDNPTDSSEYSTIDTTVATGSTDYTSSSTESSTTESDNTSTTVSSTTESDNTKSTEKSTTEDDNTKSTEKSTTEGDSTKSTESSTTESDTTESTIGSTTDNDDESSESSTTLFPITPPPPPTSTSSSTESTSETTLSTNPSSSTPTEGITPPLPSTSSTKIPVTILPPPVVLPETDKKGLTVPQILLYIVLPTVVGITAFLATVFYFGFKGYKCWGLGSRSSKEQLIREGMERSSSRRVTGGRGGSNYPTQMSPPQQTSNLSRQIGNNNASFYPSPSYHQASPSFPQSTSLQTSASQFHRQNPSAFQSQFSNRNAPGIPPSTSRPNVGRSVTLNLPNQEEIYYGTSEPSNLNGSFRRSPVLYTGEYTGGELPRFRRKMD